MTDLLVQARSGLPYDLAQYIRRKYDGKFRYIRTNSKIYWTYFQDGQWHRDPLGYKLRQLLPTDIRDDVRQMVSYYSKKAANSRTAVDIEMYLEYASSYSAIAKRLKVASYMNAIMSECKMAFFSY